MRHHVKQIEPRQQGMVGSKPGLFPGIQPKPRHAGIKVQKRLSRPARAAPGSSMGQHIAKAVQHRDQPSVFISAGGKAIQHGNHRPAAEGGPQRHAFRKMCHKKMAAAGDIERTRHRHRPQPIGIGLHHPRYGARRGACGKRAPIRDNGRKINM